MATFIMTIKFTQQGMKDIAHTTKRAAAFKASAKKHGVKVRDTHGVFDPATMRLVVLSLLTGRSTPGTPEPTRTIGSLPSLAEPLHGQPPIPVPLMHEW